MLPVGAILRQTGPSRSSPIPFSVSCVGPIVPAGASVSIIAGGSARRGDRGARPGEWTVSDSKKRNLMTQPLPDAAVRGDVDPPGGKDVWRAGAGRRGPAPAIPLPRPAPAHGPTHPGPAAPAQQGHPRLPRPAGLSGAGNAASRPQHAGRG